MRRFFLMLIPLALIAVGVLWPVVFRPSSEASDADDPVVFSNYDVDLTWTPDQMPQGPPPGALPPGAPSLPPIDPNGPSLFTAVQEQLGLKLESTRGPVNVFVIDRVEHPTED